MGAHNFWRPLVLGAAALAMTLGSRSSSEVIAQPFDTPDRDLVVTAAMVNAQRALDHILALDAHSVATGNGVLIAVLDSGFDLSHEVWLDALQSGAWDAVDDDFDVDEHPNSIDDDNDGVTDRNVGHGNFVTSLARATAPDAKILPIRCLDDEGNGTADDLAAAIDYAVAQGAHVINISAVVPNANNTLKDAVNDAVLAGVTIVTAAGNAANDLLDDPFVRDRSITVGAVDANAAVTSWSPNGVEVDIYAPGDGLIGALDDVAIDYGRWDGTSFSAAFVSGAAALALDDDATRTPEDVRDLLTNTVSSVTGATPSTRGCVDCDAAVND